MLFNTVYIVPAGSFGDKNNNLQMFTTKSVCDFLKQQVVSPSEKYKSLNLFIQGETKRANNQHWIMIESWSSNHDLFWDFCHWIAEHFGLSIELGLPTTIVDHGIDYHEL